MDRKEFYKNFSINFRNNEHEKFRHEIKDSVSKYEYQLERLVNQVPMWETLFNDKQNNIVKMFLNVKNASLVDDYLKLAKGTSWHTLFGENGKGGVLGKLYRANEILKKQKSIKE